MREKNALVVCTVAGFLNFELNDIKILKDMGYQVHVATNFDGFENQKTVLDGLDVIRYQVDFERSPFNKKNVEAYRQLLDIMRKTHFHLVHCHTPVGGVLARMAAKKYRKKGTKVIYTAHGFHFFKGAPLKNWLLYYPVEWICAWWTDVLITINREDFERAGKHMHAKGVEYVPGVGVDMEKFKFHAVSRNNMKKEWNIPKDAFILLSVGEINRNKNHQLVIRALSQIKDIQIQYFIAGTGGEIENNRQIAKQLNVEDRVHFLGYRHDIAQLDSEADIFVLPSLREGLPLAGIEALACGTLVIGMKTRGINEYVLEGVTGYTFQNTPESCASAIRRALSLLSGEGVHENCRKEAQKYSKDIVEKRMRMLYGSM